MRSSNRSEFFFYVTWMLVVAQAAILILPIIMLAVFSIVTPSYMAPMFHDPLGILLLGVAAVVLVAGGAANLLAVRMRPAHVAQVAEHFLGKEKVPGSNPGVGSRRSLAGSSALATISS